MASSKAALKKAKAAIDSQRWDEAIAQVEAVLAFDSQNYFAYAFPCVLRQHRGMSDLTDRSPW